MNYDIKAEDNYGPREPTRTGVRIQDYVDTLTNIVPEAFLQEDNTYGGLKISYRFTASMQEGITVSEEHAREILRSFGESIRIRVARDLGLRPIMDAYEREGEQLRRSIKILEDNLSRLREQNELLSSQLEERDADGDG